MEAMPNTLQNSFKLIEKKKDTILTELYSIQQVLKKIQHCYLSRFHQRCLSKGVHHLHHCTQAHMK